MIRPCLRDLINDHKPTMELTNKANNSDTERGEWKIQLIMQNNCISSKDFEEICSIYSASTNIDIFLSSGTDDIQYYKNFKKQQKHQMKKEANLFMKVLLYCIIIL